MPHLFSIFCYFKLAFLHYSYDINISFYFSPAVTYLPEGVVLYIHITMFLNQVSDSMPKTSDAVPLIRMLLSLHIQHLPLRLKIITPLYILT